MSYRVGAMTIELHLPDVHSLKAKRSIIKGLVARLRQRFNVSVAEVEYQDLWQRAVLLVAVAAPNMPSCEQYLASVLRFVEDNLEGGHVVSAQSDYF